MSYNKKKVKKKKINYIINTVEHSLTYFQAKEVNKHFTCSYCKNYIQFEYSLCCIEL